MRLPVFVTALLLVSMLACKKDRFITNSNAGLTLSADTVFFDTVFTTTGSITQIVKITNPNDQKLRLSEVSLAGGSNSSFSININGYTGPSRTDIDIAAGDSIYLFVAVTIRQGSANLPFIVQDSVLFSFNGNKEYLQLQAYGQNAHFLRSRIITANTTWNDDLPYVITGSLQIDAGATLTVMPGCKVYFHADAPLLVDGSLQALGEKYDSTRISFQSDRRDDPYDKYPGAWPGIYFRSASIDNILRYVSVKNAYQALVATSPASDASPKLTLEECIVDNSYDGGIMGTQSSIQATNCLISNCGKNIVIADGGTYQFTHCTSAGFSNAYVSHTAPVLSCSNYTVDNNGSLVTADLDAQFVNCIFWGANGNVDDEVQISRQGSNSFSAVFTNCAWKVKNTPADATTTSIIANTDPLFDSVDNYHIYYDFHLKSSSPLIDKGVATAITIDLDGSPRPVGLPDLGCYERQQ